VIDEAKQYNLPVVGHVPMTVSPEEASNAGQASIEHEETLFEGTFSAKLGDGLEPKNLADAIREFRGSQAEPLFNRFVKNGTFVTSTLVAWKLLADFPDPSRNPQNRYVARSLLETQAKEQPLSGAQLIEVKSNYGGFREVLRIMSRSGVMLLAGTDLAGARPPGFTLHQELELLVECGLTPLQALQAATLTPAKFLKRTAELGSVEQGKIADLVLLNANPLDDIKNTQQIAAVVLAGKLYPRSDIDRLLLDAEKMAEAE
jgi:imidazolonepropionase-like amidohydrolase